VASVPVATPFEVAFAPSSVEPPVELACEQA
jgi:hypothetical protein